MNREPLLKEIIEKFTGVISEECTRQVNLQERFSRFSSLKPNDSTGVDFETCEEHLSDILMFVFRLKCVLSRRVENFHSRLLLLILITRAS